ncbi:RNA polymerase Rpb3 Rpb11 dimerization domain [Trypanosoma vivax]|uniref:Plastid-encoded RNA polymerase subunit alpha n=1 Tax=Trypanosoma vivax (strain Y486) TaxID=1055687 RepID=G0TTN9_TRYVY|nr:putative DNA-directed RNA polymerase II subunit 3 [Trypanosoma vivax]KAH8607171.1 RNA polymerase Rpb3 Rpb11 dimerization domain [Trypanosoma vivax]CCC47320.1 putative DNA-directed RNA polymerase II subunit 3 [Trypanosoma vivax Y486]
MKVKILDCRKHEHSAGETLEFQLDEVDNSFANGLRRVMLAEVPVLGAESVTIIKNTSVLPDEMLAHRIGLVPLYSMKARKMPFPTDCLCGGGGCVECQVTGLLTVRCPADQHSLQVFTDSLKIDDEEVYPVSSEERGLWLLTLGRSQELDLRIVIRKSIAKTHAKFMPVSTVAMRYATDIVINTEGMAKLTPEQRKQLACRCPDKAYKRNGSGEAGHADDTGPFTLCRDCVASDQFSGMLDDTLVFVRPRRSKRGYYNFTFTVESTGVLPVLQILYDAIDVLRRKLERVRDGLMDGDAAIDVVETRPIGGAPTAPVVVNEDVVTREGEEDNLAFVMN